MVCAGANWGVCIAQANRGECGWPDTEARLVQAGNRPYCSNSIFTSVCATCITAEALSRVCGVHLAAAEGSEHLEGTG
jgi:hypothetical protein